MDRLSADDIQALVQAGESQTVEFKPESESQGDVGELLAALANTDGGIILFGVTDTQEIVGVKRLETVYHRIQAAARLTGVISRGLNPRQRDLLAAWEETGQGQIRRAEYERRYDIAVSTAAKDLQQLVAWGRVRPVGKGPQTLYVYSGTAGESASFDQADDAAEIEDRR